MKTKTEVTISETDQTVYILDSYGLIYRAYFALVNHPLTNPLGQNISAVVIFFRNLKALLSKYKPNYLVAAFDSRVPTFRHEMYPAYKANRAKTPEDLHAQVPWIEDILSALKIPVLRVDGFEADDIIATVAATCKSQNRQCRILSGDKDLLQLVTDMCKAMQPDKNNGGWETEGVSEVVAKWGVEPKKILDYLSLTGDASDNVPGVKGVGDKTALKLLSQYGTLEGIYEHADEIKGALGEKIRADRENAFFSKKLISLRTDVPLQLDFDSYCTNELDYAAAAKKLSALGAKAVAASFAAEAGLSSSEFQNADHAQSVAEKKDSASLNDQQISALETSDPLTVVQNKGDYHACTKLAELEAFINTVLEGAEKTVAFDTETDSLDKHHAHLVGFSLCCKTGTAIYVPVMLPGGMFAPECIAKSDCIVQLSRLLHNPNVTVIMHNGKFDVEVLVANGLAELPKCRIVDTMVAAWLLNPAALGKSPYGLEYLGETQLGLKGIEFKDVVQKDQTFADVPLEKAVPYGAEDADFTWQLWQRFKTELSEKKLDTLFYDMEMKVLPILVQMELRGIHLDKAALAEYSKELAQDIAEKEQEIYRAVGHEFNIASTKQLQQVLFEERKLVPGKKTKTGYSTDTAVLEELAERTTDPVPAAILDYRSFSKLQSTYVEALPALADEHGRVHTTFLQTGTATGRLSSHEPNLQNIPIRDEAGRRIRSAFTAEKGTVLISADYSQIELVVLAHLSQDTNLCKAFIDGVDVHRSTASLIYNIPPEQVTADMRRFAKTVNFGVMYGMSAFRLANELGINRTEAKNFIDQYFTTYAGVKAFISKTIASAEANGFVETIMGRRRFIPDITNKNKLIQQGAQRVAINTPIQGSAADIVKTAMVAVQESLCKSGSPARMLLQVHDELIFECPDSGQHVQEAISLIQDSMEHAVTLRVPLRVSVEHGHAWGEFH